MVVLISGRGSNMLALAQKSREAAARYSIAAVVSDQLEAGGLELARGLGIDTQVIAAAKGMQRADYDGILAAALAAYEPALIVLAGFMRILSAQFVNRYSGRLLNIHPSLLPKYPGLHTHQRVLASGDSEHGATVHFVTEQLDGGPAIIQGRVPVKSGDTEASLAARVQEQEHRIYPVAVEWFCAGRLHYAQGQAWLDGVALSAPIKQADGEALGAI